MCHFFSRIFQSRLLFAVTLMVIFYGLFLIPASGHTDRLWAEINNLGHIGAFLIIWTFVFNLFPRFTRLSNMHLLIVVIITTLVVAELIEVIQGWIGRDDELQDVWDSGVGALLAIAFCSLQVRRLAQWSRNAWRALTLLALVIVPWSVWSSLADEIILRRQVPVLCDFSTPFELSRWHANKAGIQLEKSKETERAYLAVEFRPAIYSTISMIYFYPDWRGYRRIVLDMTNPDSRDIHVVIRMHDDLHKQHQYALNDRFNRAITIKPGRQQISFAITAVENAPASRKMDLQHMEDISIFTMHSSSYHHLDIHKIYLE